MKSNDFYEPPYLCWVCRHPEIPNRFAIMFEGSGNILWLLEDALSGVEDLSNVVPIGNTPMDANAIPKVFESWTTAVEFLIEQGEDHVFICLHNDDDQIMPDTLH